MVKRALDGAWMRLREDHGYLWYEEPRDADEAARMHAEADAVPVRRDESVELKLEMLR